MVFKAIIFAVCSMSFLCEALGAPPSESVEEDLVSVKELKEQMDNDRLQQKRIKTLKLQLEQANLQLQEEKALSEINHLKRDNAGVVQDPADQSMDRYPDVKVMFIGGSSSQKQAILSINGMNYSVKEKAEPVKNLRVLSISDSSVSVHFNMPQAMTATIDYKPE